jgi:CHASE2 domain-containing sensor protein
MLRHHPENAAAPPPQSPAEQLAFNDLQHDNDYTVRRHLQSRTPIRSLPFQFARHLFLQPATSLPLLKPRASQPKQLLIKTGSG